ncbi:MAG TPA: PEP/pyruvate-binding domain-containing protein [Acidimicrobiales bacterium]|nr:PEP/pyruvate-binding domain-containing protein [Acidimicrobiales bacterium]
MTTRLRYSFTEAAALDLEERTSLLGGKGAALARMTALDLPVPPGFTLTTEACNRVTSEGWFRDLTRALAEGLDELEGTTGRRFGAGASPLLISVRSGSPVSMPGMMDTVLNVGMTDDVAHTLGAATGNDWFGWDTARRFVQSYASIVLGTPGDLLRRISFDSLGDDEGHTLDASQLASATVRMRRLLADEGFTIPTDPVRQVTEAVNAVFRSWSSDRATTYREVEGIADDLGTAATIQMMTFGNLGDQSGTGVAFTRDPSTGAPGIVGDFLVGAQGEDVVAGTHQTLPITDLRSLWPDVATQLDDAGALLEHDVTDLVDIEFTVEEGHLWLLQVRRGKRSPRAALRIAIDLAESPDFDFDRAAALERVADILADPPKRSNPDATAHRADDVLASGLAASPGRVTGTLRTGIDEAIEAEADGEHVILVRRETSPADIAGIAAAAGLVTTRGGLVSHAAVVARSWGLPAVVGVEGLTVEATGIIVGDRFVAVGETLTIDGDHGLVLVGAHPGDEIELEEVRILRSWQRADTSTGPPSGTSARGASEPATVASCSRVLAIKGMASADAVAEVLGCDTGDVATVIDGLVAAESAQALPGDRFRLLPDALAAVDEQFTADAERLGPVIEALLPDFHAANDAFKQVVTSWQMRDVNGETIPNDHTDPDHDARVVARLETEIHAAITPIIASVATSEPRFARYAERLGTALTAIQAGDIQMVAHPLRDSYHTVWFELHEELIRLSGRNRADEAAAGRA